MVLGYAASQEYTGLFGVSWSSTLTQTIEPVAGTLGSLLHRRSAESFDEYYTLNSTTGKWQASFPAELRGTITSESSNTIYALTDLNGTVTRFEISTARWKSTTDRWGNQTTADYAGMPTSFTVSDSQGRTLTFSLTGGLITQVQDSDANIWRFSYNTGNYLSQIQDPFHLSSGSWRTYGYATVIGLSPNPLSSVNDESKLLEGFTYDTLGRVVTTFAENNKSFGTLDYDTPAAGQTRVKTRINTTPTDQTSVFDIIYQGGRYLATRINGVCSSCSGADGNDQTFTYDNSNHTLTRIVGVTGEQVTTTYTYDGNGMVLTRTEASGTGQARATTFGYGYVSPAGIPWPTFVTSMTEPSAAKSGQYKMTTNAWNSAIPPETLLTTSVTGYLNADAGTTTNQTTAAFDTSHRQTQLDVIVPSPGVNQKTTFAWYTDGATNRRGRLMQTSVYTSPTAHLDTTFDNYDIFGIAKKVVDPNGVEAAKTTDKKGRVVTTTSKQVVGDATEATDYTTTYAYDLRDRLTSVTLPLGNQVQYAYEDGTNRLIDTVRADSAGKQYERLHLVLNVIGGKTQEDAQLCNPAAVNCSTWTPTRKDSFSYDTNNRLSSVVHQGGSHIDYTYDSRGNLLTIKDEKHPSANTIYEYDAFNRLTKVKQTLNGAAGSASGCTSSTGQIATCYAYDVQDNLKSVTDPKGNGTNSFYDDFRRMQSQASPVSGTTSYSYDAAGNLLSSTDANNAQTVRTYDTTGRVLTQTSTRSNQPTETVTWAYDDAVAGKYGKGRLTTMCDPSGPAVGTDPCRSALYAYDRRGLLKTEVRTIRDNRYSIALAYDANGNRKSVTYPGGRVVTYNFDFADRPTSASDGTTSYVTSAQYQPFGPLSQLDYGNGTRKTMTYDTNLRYLPSENKLVKLSPLTTLAAYTYSTDSVGNITSISDQVDPTYSRTLLGYDDLNRLTTANTGSNLWGTGSYQYDSMGNVINVSLGTLGTRSFGYSGTTAKLISANEVGPGTPGLRVITQDLVGNEATVGTESFSYSPRNLLASGNGRYYVYDGRGVRTTMLYSGAFPSLPIVTISPSHGPAAGGMAVTITGAGFASNTSVTIGGQPATGVTVQSGGQQLTATTPALPAGTLQSITVQNPSGGGGTLTGGFFVDFTDVTDPVFQPFVERLVRAGITTGCFNPGPGYYCPSDNVTRAQMAIFIARAKAGSDANVPASGTVGGNPYNCVSGGTSLFSDVLPTDSFCRHVHYIFAAGVTTGCTATTYCPSDLVTRAQMAIFISRAIAGSDAAVPSSYGPDFFTGSSYNCSDSSTLHFTDVFTSDLFCKHVHYLWARGMAGGCQPTPPAQYCPVDNVSRLAMAKFLANGFELTSQAGALRRYSFYSPELNLLAESELTSAVKPAILYEYIWFNGQPVAQVDGGVSTHWTFTDHLGTPLRQTTSSAGPWWRAEREPYGSNLFGATNHQPLGLPGQETEDLGGVGGGQGTGRELFYNIFRWYRYNWGRYTQSDPVGTRGEHHPYLYAVANPLSFIDPLGEKSRVCCTPITSKIVARAFNHCFIQIQDDITSEDTTYSLHRVRGTGCKYRDDPFDQGAIGGSGTSCGPWTEGCRTDSCVEQEHDGYVNPSQYNSLFGPNSNTYASHITTTCGLTAPPVAGTWHTPGWGDPLPRWERRGNCPPKR